MGTCPKCSRDHHRSKTGLCPRCAQAKWRTNPANRAKHRQWVKRYSKAHPEKRQRWVQTYRERVQYYAPAALLDLRRAAKSLENALSCAVQRG